MFVLVFIVAVSRCPGWWAITLAMLIAGLQGQAGKNENNSDTAQCQ
jgi:hypothetical protein